ncbi:hypothetical protein NFI96_027831 [Prochilodus magdalenae]|nr:hypothetical protein NFI96_027831 [Prochilodus magdalenae]
MSSLVLSSLLFSLVFSCYLIFSSFILSSLLFFFSSLYCLISSLPKHSLPPILLYFIFLPSLSHFYSSALPFLPLFLIRGSTFIHHGEILVSSAFLCPPRLFLCASLSTQLKKFLGKSVKRGRHLLEEYGERAVNKVKSVRDEVFHTDQDEPSSSDDEGMPYTRPVKFKAAHSFKGPFDFDHVRVVQDLSGEHMGAVWTMKFSHCGRLLATAGQDNVVRIWVLKNAYDYFNNMRIKYNTEGKPNPALCCLSGRVSPSPSQESLCSSKSDTEGGESLCSSKSDTEGGESLCSSKSDTEGGLGPVVEDADTEDRNVPFRQVPFCKYKSHTADLLDLSWSKNYFLLSSSMDKTVRLWHISRRECLCCFQHVDFVTAIAFHPRWAGPPQDHHRAVSCGQRPVGSVLWAASCGQRPVGSVPWAASRGQRPVGSVPWAVSRGSVPWQCPLGSVPWAVSRGSVPWAASRGQRPVGSVPWAASRGQRPDDRYFLSGSLDGRLRLWNIPEKKVALWNEVDGQTRLITAANFCQNGKYAVIGTYDGRCIFYDTERLKYHTQIHVRSTRGRNRVGRKITGIEPLPGENKILVTSNDSRIRLYDLRDLSLSMKYKGYVNSSSQIKASFSHDYSFIVSGSEDKYVYIWSTYHDLSKFSSVRRDRNDFWEGIKAHNAVVTSAIFAPHPGLIVPQEAGQEKPDAECKSEDTDDSETIPSGEVPIDEVPIEEVPIDEVPIDEVPIDEVPIEEVPIEEVPIDEVPRDEVPRDEVPRDEVPIEEVPIEEVPIEEVPIDEVPIDEVPIGEVPIDEVPIEEVPIDEFPIDEFPIDEFPIDEFPIDEFPIDEFPIDEVPIDEVPIDEVPIEEVPIEEVPIEEVPIEEVPIDEVPIEEVPIDETVTTTVLNTVSSTKDCSGVVPEWQRVIFSDESRFSLGGDTQRICVWRHGGALKTDHTEVLLSADFTGAIKVFVNVKKY